MIAPRVFAEFSSDPISLGAACLLALGSWVARHKENRSGAISTPAFP